MGPASLLPTQPTPLVDRTAELETIRQLMAGDGVRLLTLTGPAGVGKTRLALAAADAAQIAVRFSDGVTLVDLAPIRDPSLVLPAIARALGLTDSGHPPLSERLRDVLRERAMLLVLDNFEQVLPGAAQLADLLAGCPRLALLVTSRMPLRLRWEQALRVPPLPVPDLTTGLLPPDELVRVPAVALFVEWARARRTDFALTATRAPLVAQLVAQLDGLPLALELAAARLGALSLPMIAQRLKDRLRLLHWEAPDVPERQQSLEAAVGWSYDLLSTPEQRLFCCLGVFVGRVGLDAISAVASDEGDEGGEASEDRFLRGLVSLAEMSLVLPGHPAADEEDEDAEPAFGMLETVREYAWEQLAQRGELAAAQRAHAHYFLALAERAEPQLLGRDQRAWYLRLEREHANLRAALRWLLDQDDPAERMAGLRLTAALGWFWWRRGYHTEGWRWLEEALARAPLGEGADLAARTRALLYAGPLLAFQADFARARAVLEEALALAQQRQDHAATAEAFTYLGLHSALAGDVAAAFRALTEARARWEDLGKLFHLGFTHYLLGAVAFAQGDYAQAESHQVAALDQLEAVGDTRLAGIAHITLAVIAWQRGNPPRAAPHLHAGLHTSVTLQDRWLLAQGVRAALGLTDECADPERQARLLGAADTLGQATSETLGAYERLPAYPSVAKLRARIEREGWAAAYREGRSLPLGAIATLALTLVDEAAQIQTQPRSVTPRAAEHLKGPGEPTSQRPDRSPLSAREREVLRLVAEGRSSKAIGQQLFLSASTVNQHLTSVFHKLGVDTRAQAVAVATQRGLL